MKRFIALLLSVCLLLSACSARGGEETDEGGLQIVCTNFPAYDFARTIAGDRAEVTLLIKPGTEAHSYEPTPSDAERILGSDLFVCNGGESETWTEQLVTEDMNVLRMLDCVEALTESDEGIYKAEHGEEEELDEHVWTTPNNAALICSELCERLCALDPEGEREYRLRLKSYSEQLASLDTELRALVNNAERRVLIFADRFPMRYFTREYDLEYYAAYPGCSTQTEPSAKTVAYIIDRVREDAVPAVLYMEFSNQKMADAVCEETGCKKLPFYSGETVSADMFEDGITYLELMRLNLETLKEALC